MKRRSLGSQKNFVYWDHMSHTLGEDEDPMHSGMIEKTQDDALMAKELCEKIRDSYKDLPEIYQQVFSLRDLKGYSIKETSEMLNTTPATIKSRLHRGRGYIRANLSDYVNEN
jgi:RNA polymerase sigma factor (sigma-70 family)